MFLVELVMQGVRGFREPVRLRFQSGFNFIAAGNEAGKTTAVETMQRLLFPGSQAGLMEAFLSRHTPGASRAALVVSSNEGGYYRIIQDFSKKAVNLSQYNAGTKDFTLVHKDWDTAKQFMAGLTTGMSEGDFSRVFIFRRDHYADLSGVPTSAPPPMPRAQASKSAPLPGGKTAANQAKLAELREVLKKAEEAADAEYRAQAAKIALDDIRKKLNTIEETEQKKKEIESTLSELKGCEAMPENLSALIEAHERLRAQKTADADGLTKNIEGLKIQHAGIPTGNLYTDKLFIAGAFLGVLSILAGVFFLTAEQAHFFPIGVLLSLGLTAAAWYKGSRKTAQQKTIMKEIEGLEDELVELEKRFQQESAAINSYMKATGAATIEQLKDKTENFRYFLSLRADMEEQQSRILSDSTPEILHKEYNKQQQAALELEKAARAVSQYNLDTYSIKQDIDRIEAESAPGAAWDFGSGAEELPVEFAKTPVRSGQTGFHAELGIASRIGGIEMGTLVPAVEAAAQRNLLSITGGKYVRIDVGHDGGPPIVHTADDSVVNYAELSHGTRDLIYFCLRTGLAEALAGKRRLPFILDDPFAGFDIVRQKAACQILRSLGLKTQVILFSSNPALKADGDVIAELK